MTAYVYILRCADRSLYTGWTNDLAHRLAVHNAGRGAKYTKARLPVALAYYEELADKVVAQRREYAIKQLTRSQKLALCRQFVPNPTPPREQGVRKRKQDKGASKLLSEMSVSRFLDELASNSPAPGGGSVAALAGAMAAGLVSMVCNLSIGNEKFAAADAELRATLTAAEAGRADLSRLMEEDTAAYNAVIAAYKLAKGSDEEKAARSTAIQAALQQATAVPILTAEAAARLLPLAATAQEKGNPNAASDAYVARLLAEAAIKGALANAEINLPSVKDAAFVAQAQARVAALHG